MSSKIISTEWRSGEDTVGVVLCQLATGKFRAYIGVAKQEMSESIDSRRIADYGAKLRFREAVAFFPNLEESNYADYKKIETSF